MKYLIIVTVLILTLGCQTTKKGGAVPINLNEDLKLNVLNIDWSDLRFAPGDRRIKDTGFVVANWSESVDDVGVYFGLLGVMISDLTNEKNLQGSVESDLKENFDLAKILLDSLHSNQDLKGEIESVHLNSNIKNQVITLEPWCLIFTSKNGVSFVPQLKANYRTAMGKMVWEGFYGDKIKPFKFNNHMKEEDIGLLKSKLKGVYDEITNQLTANIKGRDTYISKEEDAKLTEDIIKNMEIQVSENLDKQNQKGQ